MLKQRDPVQIISLLLIFMMNINSFYLFAKDKRQSKKNSWRVRERSLLLFTICLGGIGSFLAMKFYRHKTKHFHFNVIVGLSALVTLGVIFWIVEWSF